MMWLVQAFMGLGLVVGIAALGVISTRAVVERRHHIGVLRAIGYRSRMIQGSFLIESSFVALLGILIGLVLALILAYNFYTGEVETSMPGIELTFNIPWRQLGLIVAIAYGASLFTTFLPAWQAARVYPAEALRYE
jgi:putative ABC transport system permease protein